MAFAKTGWLLAGLLANCAVANIMFPEPYKQCPDSIDQCIRGQVCAEKECHYPSKKKIEPRTPTGGDLSLNGACGPANGGTVCDPNSVNYTGSCCSQYGWCGNSVDHCGTGCISGLCLGTGSTTTVVSIPVASATQTQATSTTSGEPAISSPAALGVPTKDGSCGNQNGGTTCVGWSTGECCSTYGWCGNTSGHCGFGCQSGPCLVETTVSPAPGPSPAPITGGGSFAIIGNSGVPAMHAALMPNGRVVFLDKIEDYTQLKLANGQYAYSSEFDPATNAVVPLAYKTNAFCSGGTFLANGDLLAIGGNGPLTWIDPTVGDGFNGLRYLSRSSSNAALNGKDWSEPGNKLKSDRWYPSAQTLPDGRVFVASGSINGLDPTNPVNNACNYEILSATGVSVTGLIPMDILLINQPYYMYPFMHLLKDGNIFIFTARSSQIFNINGNNIVKALPNLPGDYRTYPNTGGSVLFPLSSSNNWSSKIIICGGGAYQDITSPTDPSCGVISPEDANPTWEMDSMPQGRVMVEGTLLPDGTIIWLNGANLGAQGFGLATDPTFSALHYDPTMALGKRFTQLASSTVPRMYHSVALLLLDGTLLVTGGNPTEMPSSQTQWAVERFTPPYLMGANAGLRPTAVTVPATVGTGGTTFKITFTVPVSVKTIKVTLYHGGFVTHSVHMGHRMLFLDNTGFQAGKSSQTITVTTPPNKNVAPPGPYVIYVLGDGIPAIGKFVQVV